MTEVSFVVVEILRRFDAIEALDKGPIRKVSPLDGLKLKLHRANA